jgi:uncharacterized protein YuzE
MAKKAKINYDEENDILYVYSGEKAKDSLEIDNFVLDISPDNRIVGVEIFDAINYLSKVSGLKISKESLSNISDVRMQFYQRKELFYVLIFLALKVEGKEKEINLQVPAPTAVMVKT